MAIWSFTAERLAKLKEQITKKKQEHDDLLALSEKDLWCTDLDNFVEEWERQVRLDAEIQTNINRMGRRVSKKIGAGRGRKAAAREDDDYDPGAAKKGKAKAKAAPKVDTKSHQRFAEMFSAKPKPKPKDEDEEDDVKSEFSDGDLAAFTVKSAPKKSESVEPSETLPRGGRRAAAAKPKAWLVDESDSDDENVIGDIDNMVKGIGKQPEASSSSKGRLSLFSMSQGGAKDRPKTKPKSKTFDFSDDDTNYEMLAKSSPRKSIKGDEDIDEFLSDEGFQPPVAKAAAPKPAAPKAPKPVAPAKRGRPAAASKAKPEKKKEVLSPAAKAYARKATKPAKPASEDEDEDEQEEEEEEASIAPRRPARAARTARGATKAKPKYIDSDEEENSFQGGGDDSDDPFGMDSD